MDALAKKKTWLRFPIAASIMYILVYGVTLIGAWLDNMLGLPSFPPFPFNLVIGILLVGGGFILAVASILQLYKIGHGMPWGDVNEESQSTVLVVTGVYAYTRNPMILGTLMILSGIGWLVRSLSSIIIFPVIFSIVLYIWLKFREEPRMEKRFGK
ncbi:MAG: methyltransferase family protein, partial [Candidatus Ranarchaeia archaeon]